mmetsp:Transcript_16480/g.41097  ORF Transcript_16480/g.41097 Transcript_16480/m.41097 type:complete len:350 (+) Transcript_16480:615-1664(+)
MVRQWWWSRPCLAWVVSSCCHAPGHAAAHHQTMGEGIVVEKSGRCGQAGGQAAGGKLCWGHAVVGRPRASRRITVGALHSGAGHAGVGGQAPCKAALRHSKAQALHRQPLGCTERAGPGRVAARVHTGARSLEQAATVALQHRGGTGARVAASSKWSVNQRLGTVLLGRGGCMRGVAAAVRHCRRAAAGASHHGAAAATDNAGRAALAGDLEKGCWHAQGGVQDGHGITAALVVPDHVRGQRQGHRAARARQARVLQLLHHGGRRQVLQRAARHGRGRGGRRQGRLQCAQPREFALDHAVQQVHDGCSRVAAAGRQRGRRHLLHHARVWASSTRSSAGVAAAAPELRQP